jgi:hypothetical protein
LAREQADEVDRPERWRVTATKIESHEILPCKQKKRIPVLLSIDIAADPGVSQHDGPGQKPSQSDPGHHPVRENGKYI